MSTWLFLVLLAALGAATLVWHGVTKTQQTSEGLLDAYEGLLAEAREQKQQANDDDQAEGDD